MIEALYGFAALLLLVFLRLPLAFANAKFYSSAGSKMYANHSR